MRGLLTTTGRESCFYFPLTHSTKVVEQNLLASVRKMSTLSASMFLRHWTMMLRVILWVKLPEVAVITAEYVSAGVPGVV